MFNKPRILTDAIKLGLVILAVFIMTGCNKNAEIKIQEDNQLSEIQNKLDEMQTLSAEQQQKIEEQQVKIDELQALRDSQTNSKSTTNTNQAENRSVADEVYCQTNASIYTKAKYDNKKNELANAEITCKEFYNKQMDKYEDCVENSIDSSDNCEKPRDNFCEDAYSNELNNFKKYEAGYNKYIETCN